MKRKDFPSLAMRGLLLTLLGAVALPGAAATTAAAALRAIAVSTPGSASQLQLRIDGDFAYKTVLATPDTLFIDLTGAKADRIAKNGEWSGGLLTGYRLMQFTDAAKNPVVRVQVEMRHHEAYQAERTATGLVITFGDHSATVPAVTASEPKQAVPSPAEAANLPEKTQPAQAVSGMAEVSAVFVSTGPEGEIHIDVDTSQPTPYRVLQLENPRRLVVDIDGAHKSFHQSAYPVRSPLASGVRVGQFQAKNPAVVRVVVDLASDPAFDVHARPGGIRVDLKARMTASQPAPPAGSVQLLPASKADEPKPSREPAVSPRADSLAETADTAHQTVAPLKPAKINDGAVRTQPATMSHADYQKALPADNGVKEVAAAPRPVPVQPTPEAVKAAKAAKVLAASMAINGEPSKDEAPGAAAGGQTTGTTTGGEQPHYTGEPISLNLKEVDLKDFFRLIHEISGLNIMVDPNVSGTVTLVLDNAPWDQALDIVLKDNGLGKSLEGNVLRISKLETLTSEQEAVKKLATAREDAQPLVTRFVPVNYAKASDIQALLKTWIGGGALSRRGTALIDARTNTLIISDIEAQIPVLMQIIQKLDAKSKQVSIEAQIVIGTKHFERDLQGALNYGTINPSGSTITGATAGQGAFAQGNVGIPAPSPRTVLGQTSATGFGAFVINNEGTRYFINAMIAAAETKNEARTISKPMIVTQNNVQGTVTQGTQIPIQTSINNTITVSMISAALSLTVTPQVTADGNIFLNILVTNNSVGVFLPGTPGPQINTQSATTQVLVPDGGTVVFGGVTLTDNNKTASYVPWIGDIPVIGHLFKSTSHITDQNELFFFVTPKVMPG